MKYTKCFSGFKGCLVALIACILTALTLNGLRIYYGLGPGYDILGVFGGIAFGVLFLLLCIVIESAASNVLWKNMQYRQVRSVRHVNMGSSKTTVDI